MIVRRYFLFWVITVFISGIRSDPDTTSGGTTEEEEVKVPTFREFCSDLKNTTVQPKKILYFQCLPYVLNLAKPDQMFETEEMFTDTLQKVPNEDEPAMKINVAFDQLTLLSLAVLDNNDFRPDVQIEFKFSWRDDRFKWDPNEWRFSVYPVDLKAQTHLWAPEFSLKGASSLSDLVESVTYVSTKVSSAGNVTATALAQITFSKCSSDVAAYPDDQMKCCADVTLAPRDKVVVDLSRLTTVWDANAVSIWRVEKIELKHSRKKSETSQDNGAASGLQMCVVAKRNTAALGAELSLPMAVSAIVLMCAQLAGKFKMQVYVKLFAILIQIYAFQTLIPNDTLTNATKLPRIYLFYNFTVAVTLFSLFQTMLFWALSRRWFIMPPPHRLTLSMKVISRVLLGDKMDRIENRSQDQLEEPKNSNYRKEWEVIFGTCHAVLSLLIIVAYLIGVIIIYAGGDY